MIVYSAAKCEFVEDTTSSAIHTKMLAEVKRRSIRDGSESELPDAAGVSIEYAITLTSRYSHQAWVYAVLTENYNEIVREDVVALKPCAYLYNLNSDTAINDLFYQLHTSKVLIFIFKYVLTFLKQNARHGYTGDNSSFGKDGFFEWLNNT